MATFYQNLDAAFLGIFPKGVEPGTMSWEYYGPQIANRIGSGARDIGNEIGGIPGDALAGLGEGLGESFDKAKPMLLLGAAAVVAYLFWKRS